MVAVAGAAPERRPSRAGQVSVKLGDLASQRGQKPSLGRWDPGHSAGKAAGDIALNSPQRAACSPDPLTAP